MARLDKIIQNYQEHLRNKGIKDIPEFIQSILDADMTKGKYSRFLLDCYLNDKFHDEDLKGGLNSTIGQAITLFHKHKSKLPEDMRSVYRYDSPGGLWNAVKQFNEELSGKEMKREEQDRIYEETEFVYEDKVNGFKIVSPLTEESAKWWGRGTRWCTSAENRNMFKKYAKKNPLLILLMPASESTARGGEKLQLWKNGDNIQFMDEADNRVTLEYIEQNWSVLEPVIMWLNDLCYVPEQYKTEELCKKIVQSTGYSLEFVPLFFKTKELCQLAVQKDGHALKYIPEEFKTEEMCKIAVQSNGYALRLVPEEYITEELCRASIKQNGNFLQFVPYKMITEDLCKLSVENGGVLNYVPKEYLTTEICRTAVQKIGFTLRYVPEYLKTKELCEIAVEKDGHALQYVPKHLRTEELCKLAVEQNGNSLDYVPEKYITEKLCKIAVQSNGYALRLISEKYLTEEICKLAIEQIGCAISYVPNNIKTEELCKIAVQKDGDAIDYVPEELKEKMKYYVKPFILPQEKYQQVFSEIHSFFPEKSLSLTM